MRYIRWDLAAGVWMRNFTLFRHTWMQNVLPNFFEPVFYLLGMGIGLGAYLSGQIEGQSYVVFVSPGLLATSAMNGASFETTFNMFVRKMHKVYDAYLCTPVQVPDIVAGEILWGTFRATLYGIAFYVVLLGFQGLGYSMVGNVVGAAFVPLGLIPVGMLFSTMGAFYTSLIPNIEMYSFYYTLFLTPLFMFSGVFFPLTQIPYGEAIAWWTPLYHCVHFLRGLMQGPWKISHFVSLVWILVVSSALWWGAARNLRKKIQG